MRVIVCGGRKFNDETLVRQVLDDHPIEVLINGACRGADLLSSAWARRTGTIYAEVPALWETFGKAAGHMRNYTMITRFGDIDLVIAFPGGPGTASMIRIARQKGIEVLKIEIVE